MIGISPSRLPSNPSAYVPTALSTARGSNTTGRGTEGAPETDTSSYLPEKPTTDNQEEKKGKVTGTSSTPSEGRTTSNKTDQSKNDDVIKKLKNRDSEVRAHEAAHLATAGGLAQGGPHFTYQRGPDGQIYAIGGSVSIDVSPVSGDPSATINKARIIRSAALAPTEPSGQDQAVAAAAAQMAQKAQHEISQQQTGSGTTHSNGKSTDKTRIEKAGQCSENDSASFNQTKTPASSSSISSDGKLSYGSNETMISAAGRRLQSALVSIGSTTSAPILNIFA
ncbi:hypothetical protein CCP3SC1_420001 [Gammaproteobacteria bacterium]